MTKQMMLVDNNNVSPGILEECNVVICYKCNTNMFIRISHTIGSQLNSNGWHKVDSKWFCCKCSDDIITELLKVDEKPDENIYCSE